jgi:hypothetical protein
VWGSGVGQIRGHADRLVPSAEPLGSRCHLCWVAGGDNHSCAVGDQALCGGETEPPGGAGQHVHPSCESEIHGPNPSVRVAGSLNPPAAFADQIEHCGRVRIKNVYANARNRGCDPVCLLDRLPLERVAYVHVADGAGTYHDTHTQFSGDDPGAALSP